MSAAIAFRKAAWQQIRRTAGERERVHLKGLLEAMLFASPEPMSLRELVRSSRGERGLVKELLDELAGEYEARGIQVAEVAGGYAFRTSARFAPLVRAVAGYRPVRMSRAQLESLAIIAYRQPITRPEIDEVRGVDTGPVLRTLLERNLVRVLGKKEEPGRPLLYGTTEDFLKLFNINSLGDLPTLREFTELSDEARETYQRRLGEAAPVGAITFDDEPDEPLEPRFEALDEPRSAARAEARDDELDDGLGEGAGGEPDTAEDEAFEDDGPDDDLEEFADEDGLDDDEARDSFDDG